MAAEGHIIVEAQRFESRHDEVCAFRNRDIESGVAQGTRQIIALHLIIADERGVVFIVERQRFDSGVLKRCARGKRDELMGAANGNSEIGRSDAPADLPAGEAETFAVTADSDCALAHAVELRQADVFDVVEDDVFVYFVADGDHIPFNTQVGDELQFVACENFAGGVVRRVDDDEFCFVVKGAS